VSVLEYAALGKDAKPRLVFALAGTAQIPRPGAKTEPKSTFKSDGESLVDVTELHLQGTTLLLYRAGG